MGVLDHPKMNTSAQEYRAQQQQHMHHGVEGNTKPHTGPNAFAAMKQHEARKQSTTTPQALGQGNRAVTWSNQIPRGRDQHSNWTRTPQGNNRRGEGGNSQRGRGAAHSTTKTANKEAPQHQRRHTKAKEKTTAKSQAETPTEKHNTEEPQQERNQGEDQKQTEGKESTAQNTQKQGSRRGTGPRKGEQKTPTKQQQVGANH